MTSSLHVSNHFQEYDSYVRVVLLVEYNGIFFHGSQRQKDLPTVQAAIENALTRLNLSTTAVTFSSRTDAGVHAEGQVAHFDIHPDYLPPLPALTASLNAFLLPHVVVKDVHMDRTKLFHSRREAKVKWYRYSWLNGGRASSLLPPNVAIYPKRCFDVSKLTDAVQYIHGTHNFKSFKDSDTHVTDDICHVLYANVTQNEDLIHFDIAANRFLYKMVRNLVGQLLLIGKLDSKLQPENLQEVMHLQDRRAAAAPARPEGLTLKAVYYPHPFKFFAQDRQVQQMTTLLNLDKMEFPQHENLFCKAS